MNSEQEQEHLDSDTNHIKLVAKCNATFIHKWLSWKVTASFTLDINATDDQYFAIL